MSNRPTPRVSVVIPAYNQAAFLSEAIKSVLAQTYREFELIIVDDGSTDETAQVAQAYGSTLRYTYQENQGLAGARNTGLRLARGEMVAFLDSDDAWLAGYLERMVSLAVEQPDATAYYCGWRYMSVDGNDLPQTGVWVVAPAEMYAALLRRNFLNACTVLMRREPVLAAGAFDPAFRRIQDWELWLRLLRAGHRFVGIPDILVRYRLHDESLSTDPAAGKRAIVAVVEKLFGPDDGAYETWSGEKRRGFGGAYSHCALTALQREGDWHMCSIFLQRAFCADPTLVVDLNLFYDLAVGLQPLGYRAPSCAIDLDVGFAQLSAALEVVFGSGAPASLASLQSSARGTAHCAMGLVAYVNGANRTSRRHLLAALRLRPDLIRDRRVVATLMNSVLGRTQRICLRRLFKMSPIAA